MRLPKGDPQTLFKPHYWLGILRIHSDVFLASFRNALACLWVSVSIQQDPPHESKLSLSSQTTITLPFFLSSPHLLSPLIPYNSRPSLRPRSSITVFNPLHPVWLANLSNLVSSLLSSLLSFSSIPYLPSISSLVFIDSIHSSILHLTSSRSSSRAQYARRLRLRTGIQAFDSYFSASPLWCRSTICITDTLSPATIPWSATPLPLVSS